MILDNPSLPRIDLEELQKHLFKESISATSTADPSKADQQPKTINIERDKFTRCSQSVRFRVPHRKLRAAQTTAGLQLSQSASHHEDSAVSFLPSTVPETMDEPTMEEIDETIGVVIESAERDVNGQSQQTNDATQAISQTAYDEVIRSRSEQAPSHTSQDAEEQEDDIEEDSVDDNLQHSIQEGDSEFVDILSSYAAGPGPFSPTQTQLPASQFPESQRFTTKTPATAGRKRDYAGNLIETPIESRNPFAREKVPLAGNAIGLSQAFENTQAASSPAVVMPTSVLRSDKPSPGIEIQRRLEDSEISSPSRFLTDPRYSIGPSARYVPVGQSQLLRTMTSESEDHYATQQSTNDDFDSLPSVVAKMKKAREIEAKARQELKAGSSPIQSPQNFDPSETGDLRGRARSEGLVRGITLSNSRSKSTSIPSSPPVTHNEGKKNIDLLKSVPDDIDTDPPILPASTQTNPYENSSAINLRSDGVFTLVPATSRKSASSLLQHTGHGPLSPSGSRGQQRRAPTQIVNSQKSIRSSQGVIQNLTCGSTAESVDVIPASPEGQLQSTEPSNALTGANGRAPARPGIDVDSRGHDGNTDPTKAPISGDLLNADSESNLRLDADGQPHQNHSTYATAPTNQPAEESELSSQPVRPMKWKRRRLDEISQDDDLPVASQSSAFDPIAALAADQDPEIARLLAPSHGLNSSSPRKRAKLNSQMITHSRDADQAAEEMIEIPGSNGHISGNRTPLIHDEVPTEMAAQSSPLTVLGSTPTNGSLRKPPPKSMFDLEDSPRSKKQPTTPVPRIASRLPRTSLQEMPANQRRRLTSKTKLGNPKLATTALPSIEEASPDPLAIDAVSVVSDLPRSISKTITASQMVFVRFNGAYYPGICQGYSSETEKYIILWPGYAPENMARNSLCSLDLRTGDEVKVDLPNWPKKPWRICGFGPIEYSEPGPESIRDIYGHSSIMLEPKDHKHAMPKGVGRGTLIPLDKVYIDSNQWARVNKRPFVYQTAAIEIRTSTHTPRFSSPQTRTSNASTPSPRGRKIIKDISIQSAIKGGIFSNMTFVLSFNDLDNVSKITDLIRDNGGSVVQSSFRELVSDDIQIKTSLTSLKFAALIADRHSRKEKYMQALAFGLPCLSGRWIEVSVRRQELVDWQDYLLPAGESKELDGAVRSRTLQPINITGGTLSAIFERRPQFLTDANVIFLKGRNKAEITRKTFHFFVRVVGAARVEEVNDLMTLKSSLKSMVRNSNVWVIVDEKESKDPKDPKVFIESKDFRGASDIIRSLEREIRKKGGNKKDVEDESICRVADHEFIMQSLILGRLCDEDSEQ